MSAHRCPEYARLETEVSAVLQKLKEITEAQLDAFREGDDARFVSLDQELETTVGVKERVVGALRQHALEHKCQP